MAKVGGGRAAKVLSFIRRDVPICWRPILGQRGTRCAGKGADAFRYQGGRTRTPEDITIVHRRRTTRNLGTNLFAQTGWTSSSAYQRDIFLKCASFWIPRRRRGQTRRRQSRHRWLTERGQARTTATTRTCGWPKNICTPQCRPWLGANADAAPVDAAVQARVAAEFERLFQQSGVKSLRRHRRR